MLDDEHFMRRCLKLGRRAMANGDAPVGSLVVFDGKVVAEGIESVRFKFDVTAHAEIEAIRLACEKQHSLDLTGATLYTNVEPCWMCSCAIRRTKIGRVAFGSKNEEVGGVSSGGAVGKSYRQCVDEGFLVSGDPKQVTEQMEHLITSLKVGHVFCLMHIGDMPRDKCEKSTRLFAEQVMPKLRHLWDGYEDHWSPTPLDAGLMASPQPINEIVKG